MENGLKNVKIRPIKVIAGDKIRTSLEYSGNLKNGFFDNAIINCNNALIDWNPDPNTFNLNRYSGILHGNIDIKSNWIYFIPEWILPGKCIISVRVYDDIYGNKNSRKLIDRKDVEITVNNSESDIIIFLNTLYNKLFSRNPDQNGLKTWYVFMQIVGYSKSVVIENGFLNSPEYRLRYFYKLMNLDENINQKLYNDWYKEVIRYGVSDNKPFNQISKLINFKSSNLSNKEYYQYILDTFLTIDDISKRLIKNLSEKRINKIDFTLSIINDYRIKKLIIFNKFYTPIIDNRSRLKTLSDYVNGILTFDQLWDIHYRHSK